MYEEAKKHAALRALTYIRPNIILGLGSGTTSTKFVQLFAEKFPAKETVACVCTSSEIETLARRLGLNVIDGNSFDEADVTVDGADEATPALQLIKGGGGALMRERIVAAATKRHITVVDESKVHQHLGSFPLPIEIAPYGTQITTKWISEKITSLGLTIEKASLRMQSKNTSFVTDNGNYLFDVKLRFIDDPAALSAALYSVTGVIDHGIFLGLTDVLIVARNDGHIEELTTNHNKTLSNVSTE
jgi:ribose 5-phosphate isomerase A